MLCPIDLRQAKLIRLPENRMALLVRKWQVFLLAGRLIGKLGSRGASDSFASLFSLALRRVNS